LSVASFPFPFPIISGRGRASFRGGGGGIYRRRAWFSRGRR
jgi:hypothetical protein